MHDTTHSERIRAFEVVTWTNRSDHLPFTVRVSQPLAHYMPIEEPKENQQVEPLSEKRLYCRHFRHVIGVRGTRLLHSRINVSPGISPKHVSLTLHSTHFAPVAKRRVKE